ncbi:MAG: radical SAM protein [Candidatus Hydrogenedentota bacterium]
MNNQIIISEIFYSILGESSYQGLPFIIIRLAGCNLKCSYCDTVYAQGFEKGRKIGFEEIYQEIKEYKVKRVLITGGEPLLQTETLKLINYLLNLNYFVLLETNGSLSLKKLPENVIKIVDVKCPGSGEGKSFLKENLKYLHFRDQLKFVISNRSDFEFAINFIRKNKLAHKVEISFSPAYNILSAFDLACWILESKEDIYLNIQLHKIINVK